VKDKGLRVLRLRVYQAIDPLTGFLVRRRVHPNAITILGFLTTVVAGFFYHLDHVRWAGLLVLLGGLMDIFDGRVARVSGLASKFGSFFDSTLDRISEIVVFLGLASLYNTHRSDPGDVAMVYVIMLAMGGSLMVSYTRARAEGLGFACSVGLMQRAERIVLLGLGSLVFGLAWDGLVLSLIIIVVAVLTNVTAIQRIVWVHRYGAGVPLEGASAWRGQPEEGKGGFEDGQT